MSFADILSQIAEQTDRDNLSAMAAKYPSLKNYAEMGENLSRLQPRLRALGDEQNRYDEKPELAVGELEKWHKWKATDYPRFAAIETENQRLTNVLGESQVRIQELEAQTGTEMTPDEIRAIVVASLKDEGVVTNKALEDRLTKALSSGGEVFNLVDNTQKSLGSRFQEVYSKLTPTIARHSSEFGGEVLEPSKVFDYMTKNGINDPMVAYDQMVAPLREENRNKKHEADMKAAREEGVKTGRQEAAAASGRGMPVDGGGGTMRKLGALERRRMEMANDKPDTSHLPLGKGMIASKYAQDRQQKIAGGVGQ